MCYAVVVEKANANYSAYVPDLPGCVATAVTVHEVEEEIRDAIRFHIEGLKEDGLSVPSPTSIAEYVETWSFCFELQGRESSLLSIQLLLFSLLLD